MSDKEGRLVIADLRGGRNAVDPPWLIKDNEVADAVNVDYWHSRFGHKRGGTTAIATTFSAGGPFTGRIYNLFRYVPAAGALSAELWASDNASPPVWGRSVAGAQFVAPTLKDAGTNGTTPNTATTINNNLFVAYVSAVARMHCWDGSTVRRTGLAATGAPTVANTGSGSYAATLRYYRMRSTVQAAGVTLLRSEPSASVSITPSGSGAAARVTKATAINEGETHWEVEASTDNVTFYRIATVPIATATYDDSAVVTSYNLSPLSALTGVYTLQKPYKFVAADQNRFLGFGSNTSTDKQARLEMSAVIGSSDIGDAERVDTTTNYYIDFDEADGGLATGLAGPIYGTFFVFKQRQMWQLIATGNTDQPYQQKKISGSVGAIHQLACAIGEDENGNPALYFMSYRGPYRWTIDKGLQYIGRGIEDIILDQTTSGIHWTSDIVSRAVYYADKRQAWFWISTGVGDLRCNQMFIYDVIGGGWSRVPKSIGPARMSAVVMYAHANDTVNYVETLKPFIARSVNVGLLAECDDSTTDVDTGDFQAYVTTKAYEPGGPGFYGSTGTPTLLAAAASGVTITDTVVADFGLQTTGASAVLTATAAGETRVMRQMNGTAGDGGIAGNVGFVQHQIGDASALPAAWTLDRLIVPFAKNQGTSR